MVTSMSLRKSYNLAEKFLEIFLVMTSLFSGVARGYGFYQLLGIKRGFPGGSALKLPVNAGDTGLVPGSGRFPGEGNGNPLQYSCLGNPMGREEPGRLQSMGLQKSST